MHANTRTCIHTRTHTYIHMYIQTNIRNQADFIALLSSSHMRMSAGISAQAYINSSMCTYIHTYICIYKHTYEIRLPSSRYFHLRICACLQDF